jgi:hypothetical protein
MTDQKDSAASPFLYWEGLLLLLAFVVVSVVFAVFVWLVNQYPSRISLPMLSIAGIVLLLLCLAAIAYVFNRAGLQDRTQALGLPQGSIQAVIALSLIVLFAILSVFLFTSIGEQVRPLTGLSAAERDRLIGQLASSFAGWQPEGGEKFTVFVRDPGAEARDDAAKQLIVLIGTLMTSAVSFYFGSRAASAAPAPERLPPETARSPAPQPRPTPQPPPSSTGDTGASPRIAEVEPGTIPRGQEVQVAITGTGLSGADGVIMRQGPVRLDVGPPRATDTGLTCNVAVPAAAATGSYEVVVTRSGQEIASGPGVLRVTE